MGVARFNFREVKSCSIPYILSPYADAFPGDHGFGYLVLNKLRLIDTVWAVILPGAASTFPVFIMTRFFMAIPETVMEAAAVDGASPFQIFARLEFPGGIGDSFRSSIRILEYWNAMEAP